MKTSTETTIAAGEPHDGVPRVQMSLELLIALTLPLLTIAGGITMMRMAATTGFTQVTTPTPVVVVHER